MHRADMYVFWYTREECLKNLYTRWIQKTIIHERINTSSCNALHNRLQYLCTVLLLCIVLDRILLLQIASSVYLLKCYSFYWPQHLSGKTARIKVTSNPRCFCYLKNHNAFSRINIILTDRVFFNWINYWPHATDGKRRI